jgi:hypothetical protein
MGEGRKKGIHHEDTKTQRRNNKETDYRQDAKSAKERTLK